MTLLAQAPVPRDIGVFEWLLDSGSWSGTNGILASLADTVALCAIVVAIAAITMVPLASWLAHTRRGEVTVAWMVTLSRAIPTFAVAGLLVPISLRSGWGFEPWPIFIALLLLALPPIFLNTYTAIQQVNPGVVDAARAMGYSEGDVLFRVELPLATSVMLAGVRIAAVTVVATEPIRAFLGGDGLGRYIRDGLGQNNDGLVIAGAILIAGLAGLTALSFRSIELFALPQGVRRMATATR
ncbi:MAG: ABC transporter permease subunit [Acidimicrobiia bacterium]|nr:ABC transporter permease subunit [Acidimicrobiia bacterium]